MQFLYDADEFYRFRGAEALGHLCRGNVARNFILRLFWHLSDESGAYCVGAPIGIAEIGRTNPDVFEGFKNKYVSLIDDWEVERKYVVYGIGRLAEVVRDAYPDPAEKIREVLESEKNATTLAYAVRTVVKIECECKELIEELTRRDNPVEIYSGKIVRTTLGKVARAALKNKI